MCKSESEYLKMWKVDDYLVRSRHDWMQMRDPAADNSTFFSVGAQHVRLKPLAGKVAKNVPKMILYFGVL